MGEYVILGPVLKNGAWPHDRSSEVAPSVCVSVSRPVCGVVRRNRSRRNDGKVAEGAKAAQACRLWGSEYLQVEFVYESRDPVISHVIPGADESEEALEAELLALQGKSPAAGKGKKGSKVMSMKDIDSMVAGFDNMGEVRGVILCQGWGPFWGIV